MNDLSRSAPRLPQGILCRDSAVISARRSETGRGYFGRGNCGRAYAVGIRRPRLEQVRAMAGQNGVFSQMRHRPNGQRHRAAKT